MFYELFWFLIIWYHSAVCFCHCFICAPCSPIPFITQQIYFRAGPLQCSCDVPQCLMFLVIYFKVDLMHRWILVHFVFNILALSKVFLKSVPFVHHCCYAHYIYTHYMYTQHPIHYYQYGINSKKAKTMIRRRQTYLMRTSSDLEVLSTVVNLSRSALCEVEISLLSKGPSFCPTLCYIE